MGIIERSDTNIEEACSRCDFPVSAQEGEASLVRARAEISSQNWRPDLGAAEDGLKMECENVKLFLRVPLA